MKKYTNWLILLFLLLGSLPVFAIDKEGAWSEYEEVIKKSFSFNTPQPSISLSNSYGDLTITSSDQQGASIEVTITVEAKSKARANEIFEHIHVDFDDDQKGVEAKTSFVGKQGGWAKKNEKFNIDYKVAIPEEAFLVLKNRYGNISLSDHRNDVEVKLQYGSGNLQNIFGNLELKLSYADKFYVGEVEGDLELKLAYSHLSVDAGKVVECVSSYSDVSFDEIGNIECDSQYDDIVINQANNLNLDGKYSDFSIGSIEEIRVDMAYSAIKLKNMLLQGIFDTSYGSVRIRNVETTAKKINIESQHTGYRIGYNGGMSLNIETEYTDVTYPDDLVIKFRDKDDNELNLKGSKKGVGNLEIIATMEYGYLKIDN